MNIADRIQHLRKINGISQEKLADEIGVSRQTISKWESEQSVPDIEKITLMSDYFGVTTDYLIKGIEPISDVKELQEKKPNAVIFTIAATAFNFIGLVVSFMVWYEEQTATATAIGMIFIIMGCMIYTVGQVVSDAVSKKHAKKLFMQINIWIIAFIVLSVIYGVLSGFGPVPYPIIAGPIIIYALFWFVYFAVCISVTLIIYKRNK